MAVVDTLLYKIGADSQELVAAMKSASEAVRRGAAFAAKSAQAGAEGFQGWIEKARDFKTTFAKALDGAQGELGKLSSSLQQLGGELAGGGSSLAGTAVSAASEIATGFAQGGPVGAAFAGLAVEVKFITDLLRQEKAAAEAAAKAEAERVDASAKERAEAAKALSDVRAQGDAIAKAQRDPAAQARLDKLALAGLQDQIDAAKRLADERAAGAQAALDAVEKERAKGSDADQELLVSLRQRLSTAADLSAEAHNKEAAAQARFDAEQEAQANARAERAAKAREERATARRGTVELDVTARAAELEAQGASSAVAHAQAEAELAAKLSTATDAKARSIEVSNKWRAVALAEAADARAKQKALEDLAKSTIAGLEEQKAGLVFTTDAEKALWETEEGRYKNLDDASKARILALTGEITAIKAQADEDKRLQENRTAFERELSQLQEKTQSDAEKRAAFEEHIRQELLGQKDAAELAAKALAAFDAGVAKTASDKLAELHKRFLDELAQLQSKGRTDDENRLAQIAGFRSELDKGIISENEFKDAVDAVNAAFEKQHKTGSDALKELKSLGEQAVGSFVDQFVDFFGGQQKSWADWARETTAAIAKVIAKMLILKGIEAIGSAFSAGGEVKAAGGGLITGPGTATSDSIPARLSAGEYVIRAAAVQRYGAGLFEALNRMQASRAPVTVPPVARYAGGGFVAQPAGAPVVRVTNVNVLDPSIVENVLRSSAGQQVIRNVIAENPRAIRDAARG